ncbi:MAG: hypothetical protein H8E44_29675 [Planctomycetes bacterium]|nr:hypothetical protein [Planctomycetota bacterium]MBL7040097.1 hypothetical protein [Pirellulaceae bacterium]
MVRVLVVSVLLSFMIATATFAADARVNKAMMRRPLAPSVKVLRYAQRVVDENDANGDGKLDESEWSGMEAHDMAGHDTNGDGRLDEGEWSDMRGHDLNRDGVLDEGEWNNMMERKRRMADTSQDGAITPAEFAEYVAKYGYRRRIRLMPALQEGRDQMPSLLSPNATPSYRERAGLARSGVEASRPNGQTQPKSDATSAKKSRIPRKYTVSRTSLPKGLPSWFILRDTDGDAQLTLAEYARDASETSIKEFTRYDGNGDGVVTPQECLRAPMAMGLAGAASGRTKRPIADGSDGATGKAVTDQTGKAVPAGGAVTDPTKRKTPPRMTKEEIRQLQKERALLRKNQSNKSNRTNRDRSTGSQ